MEINEPSLTMIAKLTNHFLINRILHPVRPGKPRETEELSEFKAIIRCDFFFKFGARNANCFFKVFTDTLSVVDPSFVSSEEDVSLVFNAQSNSFLFFFFRARIGVAKGELVCALLITVICLSKLPLVL